MVVRQRFEAACASAKEIPGNESIYFGPLWDLPSGQVPEGDVCWKRAVLSRIDGGGAAHWGHIYLFVTKRKGRPSISTEKNPLTHQGNSGMDSWELGQQGDLHLWLLALANPKHGREPLAKFGELVAGNFRASKTA